MKLSTPLLICMTAITAASYPINTSDTRDGLYKPRIQRRARIQPISTTPASHRPFGMTRKPVAARPVLRKADGLNGNGNGNGQPSRPLNGQLNGVAGTGSGNGNGKAGDLSMEKLTKFPPAQAAAHTYQHGFIRTSNDDNLDASTRTTFPSHGIQDRRVVKGPVAAFAGATALGDGGGSATAIGHARVAATVLNHPGTRACVHCKLPGQNPIQVTVGSVGNPVQLQALNSKPHLGEIKIDAATPGCINCTFPDQNTIKIEAGNRMQPVKIQASNKYPHSGPISIQATQDGPGSVTAAASNRPE